MAASAVPQRVMQRSSCDEVAGILRDAVEYGTASRVFTEGIEITGKSGASNGNYDVWFSGYASGVTMTSWAGKLDGKALHGMGSKAAMDIWKEVIQSLHSY